MKFENTVIGLVIFSLLLAGLGYGLFKLQKLESGAKGSNPQAVIATDNRGIGTTTPSTEGKYSWRYSESMDPLYGARRLFACVRSSNDVQLSLPSRRAPAELCLRNSPKFGLDVYVRLQGDGQILCDAEGCSVRAKFDHGAVRSFPASAAADHSTNIIFIDRTRVQSFLAALKTSSSAIVEISLYKNGAQELAFNTANLVWK